MHREDARNAKAGEILAASSEKRHRNMSKSVLVVMMASGVLAVSARAQNFRATGGDITNVYSDAGTTWAAHVFTHGGDFVPRGNLEVEYLIVAGGGGGGSRYFTRTGGGGGAGGPGQNGVDGGAGGMGVASSIANGTPVTYAMGGDGAALNPADSSRPAAALANTGKGGKGTNKNDWGGGNGGSGIVVIRYQLPPAGTILIVK